MAKKRRYAIIDIETTGGMYSRDKITEIAVVIHDGKKIISQYESLINPERSIPREITRITGITDDMVQDAPRFYEVAKEIVELTKGTIFVAHNVRFDYSFIKEEFKNLGYTFTRRQLCTVRLSRQAFPGLDSYSLGNLIRTFEIEVENRHRALDDVLATAQIFEMIIAQEESEDQVKVMINHGVKEAQLPKNINIEDLHELPEETGVYYFHDSHGDVIYIGKAKSIKDRIFQHFNKVTKKAGKLYQRVHSISYELTGSELVALLHEANEIKTQHPEINVALKKKDFNHVLLAEKDDEGYYNLLLKRVSTKISEDAIRVREYTQLKHGRWHLQDIVETYDICQLKTSLGDKQISCNCMGSCQLPDVEEHNELIELLVQDSLKLFDRDCILIDKGRNTDESAVICIQDGKYQGYGYINNDDVQYGIEELLESINPKPYYPIMNKLIWNHLRSNRLKTIPM